MHILRFNAACTAALLAVSGCAYQRGGLASQTSRVIRSETRAQQVPEPVLHVAQDGTRVTVSGEHHCRTVRDEVVETTSYYGRTSTMPVEMVAFGIVGALGIAGGSLLAANVFGFPYEAMVPPSYDGLTVETALLGGIVLIAAGAVSLGISVGHGFGLLATDAETSERRVDRGPSGAPFRCSPPAPMSGASVSLVAGDGDVHLGALGPSGELRLDASLAIEPAFVLRHAGQRIPVRVGAFDSGAAIAMEPFEAQVEERVWARAEATRCAAAEVPEDCRALERYLALFPSGTHAEQARAVLEQAHARLAERARRLEEERAAEEARRRAEEEAWRAEQERERRAREAEWEREVRARQAAEEARRQALEEAARRRQARAECERTCRRSCAGNAQCEVRCRAQQCR